MTKIKYIVEYKRVVDREWRFICGTGDYDKAKERYEEAQKTLDAAEIRMRRKIEQSQIVEEWGKDSLPELPKGEDNGADDIR